MLIFLLIHVIITQLTPSISGSTLYISGNEEITQKFIQSTGDYQGYRQIIINEGITKICYGSFHSCKQLIYLQIPSSVEQIEKETFMYCFNLAEIRVAKNSNFFRSENGSLFSYGLLELYKCPMIVLDFTIPEVVTTLKTDCFHACILKKIIIPKSVAIIETKCFTDIKIENFKIEFQKGSKLTELPRFFTSYSYIKQIQIPKSVERINDNAFTYSTKLINVTFEDGSELKYLGSSIMSPTIEYFELPNQLTNISKLCFSRATALRSIVIPSKVNFIAIDAFTGCSNLTTITCNSNPYYVSEENFLYNIDRTQLIACSVEKDILKIGSNLKEIGPTVIQLCGLLKDVEIKDNDDFTKDVNVIYKGQKAFAAFGSAESIQFREDCTGICDYACQSLRKLGEVSFKGTKVISVGYRAFYESSITKIAFNSQQLEIQMEAFAYCSNLTQCTFNDGITIYKIFPYTYWFSGLVNFVLTDSVTHIDEQAFRSCLNLKTFTINPKSLLEKMETSIFYLDMSLKSIYIPQHLQSIPEYCFMNCTNLSTIEFHSDSIVGDLGIYCLKNTNLSQIELPKALTTVQSYAFECCQNLITVTFHQESQLQLSGGSIFNSCPKLKTVILPPSLQSLNPFLFYGCTSLDDIQLEGNSHLKNIQGLIYNSDSTVLIYCPGGIINASVLDTVSSISDNAFYGAKSLVSVEFMAGCSFTDIKSKTFYECISLTSIQIPSQVSNIMDEAFYSCISLQNVVFGNESKINEFGRGTFYGCTNLTKIIFQGKNNLKRIGPNAFEGCQKLNDGVFINYASDIGESAFSGCISLSAVTVSAPTVNPSTFFGCVSLLEVSLTNAVSIGSKAFQGCVRLNSVNLLKVQTIGSGAFESCSELRSISFGELHRIEEGAFRNSGLMGLVVVPGSVETIGLQCFAGTRISQIHFCGLADPAGDLPSGAVIIPVMTLVLVSYLYNTRIFCGRTARYGLAGDCSSIEGTDNDFPSQLHAMLLFAHGLVDENEGVKL